MSKNSSQMLSLLKRAESGNRKAQVNLGCAYWRGEGVVKDIKIAVEWWHKAAEKGCKIAQHNLGIAYSGTVQEIPKNEEKSLEFYRLSAEQGYSSAQYFMGSKYLLGEGVFKSEEQAFVWFRKSAKQKDKEAQYVLGLMLRDNMGVAASPKNSVKAVKWITRAAERDHPKAQMTLAQMYLEGKGLDKNEKLAFKWYLKAAKLGNKDAQFIVGLFYKNGEGSVKKDPKKALSWLLQSAKQGNVKAKFNMGHLYLFEEGAFKNEKYGAFWVHQSVSQGRWDGLWRGQLTLGIMYLRGQGVPKNEKLAFYWLEKNARQLIVQESAIEFAKYSVGALYWDGKGPASINSKLYAICWFRLAAEQGYNPAIQLLKSIHSNLIGLEFSLYHQLSLIDPMLVRAEISFEDWLAKISFCMEEGKWPEPNLPDGFEKECLEEHHKCFKNLVTDLSLDVEPNSNTQATPPLKVEVSSVKPHSQDAEKALLEKDKSQLEEKKSKDEVEKGVTSQQLVFITKLEALGLNAQFFERLQRLLSETPLLPGEFQEGLQWAEDFKARLFKLETEMEETARVLGKDLQTQQEQRYIDAHSKLKNYQRSLQRELCCFMSCYFLAPAKILGLEGNKKDILLSIIGEIPAGGIFLKLLTKALAFVNKKHRFSKMNAIREIFTSLDQITEICCVLARQITLLKEESIQALIEPHYEGVSKIKGYFGTAKAMLDEQWKDLATSDGAGLTRAAEEKLAVLDCAYILQQILEGKCKINRNKPLVPQFIKIVSDKPYVQRKLNVPISASLEPQAKVKQEAAAQVEVHAQGSQAVQPVDVRTAAATPKIITSEIVTPELEKLKQRLIAQEEINRKQIEEMRVQQQKQERLQQQLAAQQEHAQRQEYALGELRDFRKRMEGINNSYSGGSQLQISLSPFANSEQYNSLVLQHEQRLRAVENGLAITRDVLSLGMEVRLPIDGQIDRGVRRHLGLESN